MPPERTVKSRQDPVSCHMCRAKKLKCDREQPCSNCVSRGWTCEYAGRQDPVACRSCRARKLKCDREQPCASCSSRGLTCEYSLTSRGTPSRVSHPERTAPDDLEAENIALRSRLDRLEQAVFGGTSQRSSPTTDDNALTLPSTLTTVDKAESAKIIIANHHLEDVCVSLNHAVPQFREEVSIVYHDVDGLIHSAAMANAELRIVLPSQETAYRLLDFYEENLDTVQHVMHVPSFRRKLRTFYESWPQPNLETQTGMIALFLAICAQVGVYDAYGGGVFPSRKAGMTAAIFLAKQGLKMIDHARASPREVYLELVQACILLEFFCYHIEGYSLRARLLHSTSVTLAREIDLHKTDAQTVGSRPQMQTRMEIIDNEVRRKLWWHLTSTDWLIAFIGGPAEGIYSINPRHIQVLKPRNINNDDLENQDALFTRPEQEQTIMSYYNQRVKLATICRDAVDVMYGQEAADVPYDRIIGLEIQFGRLFADLPRFLRLDTPSEVIQRELGERYSTRFALQRATTNLMAYSRRCKLHLPFLLLARSHERYTASRRQCLESARKIFEVRKIFVEDTSTLLNAFVKVLGIYHHVFYATLVLVMDLCINNPYDEAHLDEARTALKIVEELKEDNPLARQFLDSLGEVLRRYRVKIPAESTMTTIHRASRPLSATVQTMRGSAKSSYPATVTKNTNHDQAQDGLGMSRQGQHQRSSDMSSFNLPGFCSHEPAPQQNGSDPINAPIGPDCTMPDPAFVSDFGVPEFEDFWQNCLGQDVDLMNLDLQDWDALRSDLETRII